MVKWLKSLHFNITVDYSGLKKTVWLSTIAVDVTTQVHFVVYFGTMKNAFWKEIILFESSMLILSYYAVLYFCLSNSIWLILILSCIIEHMDS